VQRKVFRIERMLDSRMTSQPASTAAKDKLANPEPSPAGAGSSAAAGGTTLGRELSYLHNAIAGNRRDLATLIGEGRKRCLVDAAGKLGAAIEGMEKATVKILKSAEAIDDSAKAHAAAFKTDFARGVAHDIQDHVVTIYEACNFQDLAGQRIASVIAVLDMIEDRMADILGRRASQPGDAAVKPSSGDELLSGPRLDGASGHTSQSDNDILFD
jgi:chemotaxis protein CheZ